MNIWKIATLGAMGIVAGMYLTMVNQGRAHQSTTARASRGESSKSVSLGSYKVTAYCDCHKCCGVWSIKGYKGGKRVPADWEPIESGDKFAAAPKSIPFGTVLDIPGYGRVPVRDRGGAIKGKRIDVFFDDKDGVSGHQRALNWGVQVLDITQVVK